MIFFFFCHFLIKAMMHQTFKIKSRFLSPFYVYFLCKSFKNITLKSFNLNFLSDGAMNDFASIENRQVQFLHDWFCFCTPLIIWYCLLSETYEVQRWIKIGNFLMRKSTIVIYGWGFLSLRILFDGQNMILLWNIWFINLVGLDRE